MIGQRLEDVVVVAVDVDRYQRWLHGGARLFQDSVERTVALEIDEAVQRRHPRIAGKCRLESPELVRIRLDHERVPSLVRNQVVAVGKSLTVPCAELDAV